ncbi:MAG TPA: ABC transporter permease [Thermodesulfovibrionia bacterium]|nr:ABC transporter permease [Thermodesulfovibrionia bacterium]
MSTLLLNLVIGLKTLAIFKVRAILAITGVILGTLSVVLVNNVTGSLKEKTARELASLGKDILVVRSDFTQSIRTSAILSGTATLTLEDARAIQDTSPFVNEAIPYGNIPFPVRYEKTTVAGTVVAGTKRAFFDLRGYTISTGRFFSEEEDNSLERIAVIGSKVAQSLFPDEAPLGKFILLERIPCKIIGILEPKGADISGLDQDNLVFIPLRTYMRRLTNTIKVNIIYVQASNKNKMAQLKGDIDALLRQSHKLQAGEKNDFTVIDLKDILRFESEAMKAVETLGLIAAAISFTISAMGILSIMVLMVNERKVEIGIRRALGARKRDILFQFLSESSVISLTGGIAGFILGGIISLIVFHLAKLPFYISIKAMSFAIAASSVIGILSGLYPASRAARIRPVDVLRK